MNIALYRSRDDGDYDFVAAFDCDQLLQAPTNWLEELKEWIEREGDKSLTIENLPLDQLVDVWSPQMQPLEAFETGNEGHIKPATNSTLALATDDIIQLFRLLDLAKLRKTVDSLDYAQRRILNDLLKGCQRQGKTL